MGCIVSNPECTTEEIELLKLELIFPYHNQSPKKIDLLHRKYSSDEKINKNQWDSIREYLAVTDNDYKLKQFYDSFIQNDCYSLRGLILLGILLSYGNFKDKAKILFEIVDLNCNGFIGKNDLENLFDDLFDISVNKFSILLDSHEKRILRYLKFLKENVKVGKQKIIQYFWRKNKDQMTKKQFIKRFERSRSMKLLTSGGIRKLIYDSECEKY